MMQWGEGGRRGSAPLQNSNSLNSHYKITKNVPLPPPPLKNFLDPYYDGSGIMCGICRQL